MLSVIAFFIWYFLLKSRYDANLELSKNHRFILNYLYTSYLFIVPISIILSIFGDNIIFIKDIASFLNKLPQGIILIGNILVITFLLIVVLKSFQFINQYIKNYKNIAQLKHIEWNFHTNILKKVLKKYSGIKYFYFIELNPQILVSKKTHSPFSSGVLKPYVVLPESLIKTLPSGDLLTIVAHELAHLKNGDVFTMFVQRIAKIFHFWNPLFYKLDEIIDFSQELRCDFAAIDEGINYKDYVDLILDIIVPPYSWQIEGYLGLNYDKNNKFKKNGFKKFLFINHEKKFKILLNKRILGIKKHYKKVN